MDYLHVSHINGDTAFLKEHTDDRFLREWKLFLFFSDLVDIIVDKITRNLKSLGKREYPCQITVCAPFISWSQEHLRKSFTESYCCRLWMNNGSAPSCKLCGSYDWHFTVRWVAHHFPTWKYRLSAIVASSFKHFPHPSLVPKVLGLHAFEVYRVQDNRKHNIGFSLGYITEYGTHWISCKVSDSELHMIDEMLLEFIAYQTGIRLTHWSLSSRERVFY